jgi:hypothetical protein
MLPQEMGCGSGMTCWRRLRDWHRAGVWRKSHDLLLSRLEHSGQIVETLRTEASAEGAGDRVLPRRSQMWYATWQMIKGHPTSGTGFGAYWRAIDGYYDAIGEFVPKQAHNDYLEIIASGGLAAVALTAWFVTAVVKRSRKCLQRARLIPPCGVPRRASEPVRRRDSQLRGLRATHHDQCSGLHGAHRHHDGARSPERARIERH